ncbi:MAG: hypothetical protein AMXMBFR46_08490 [Acidimicrobiia bacterium]
MDRAGIERSAADSEAVPGEREHETMRNWRHPSEVEDPSPATTPAESMEVGRGSRGGGIAAAAPGNRLDEQIPGAAISPRRAGPSHVEISTAPRCPSRHRPG